MNHAIDAIYEKGTFRPLQPDALTIAEGQRVRLTVHDESQPDILRLAARVYEGLSEQEISDIERIALQRGSFFGRRAVDESQNPAGSAESSRDRTH